MTPDPEAICYGCGREDGHDGPCMPELDDGPPDPYADDPAYQEYLSRGPECPSCGSEHTKMNEPVPSMMGYGTDESLHCTDCDQSFAIDPFTGEFGGGKKKLAHEAFDPNVNPPPCPNCGAMLSGTPQGLRCVAGAPGEHQGYMDSNLLPPGTKEGGCGWSGTEDEAAVGQERCTECGGWASPTPAHDEGCPLEEEVDQSVCPECGGSYDNHERGCSMDVNAAPTEGFNKYMDKILVQEGHGRKVVKQADSPQRARAARLRDPLGRTRIGGK